MICTGSTELRTTTICPFRTPIGKKCRFDSLEELLLVKGVTSDILYGNKDRHGLIDFITVYTKKNRINIMLRPKKC